MLLNYINFIAIFLILSCGCTQSATNKLDPFDKSPENIFDLKEQEQKCMELARPSLLHRGILNTIDSSMSKIENIDIVQFSDTLISFFVNTSYNNGLSEFHSSYAFNFKLEDSLFVQIHIYPKGTYCEFIKKALTEMSFEQCNEEVANWNCDELEICLLKDSMVLRDAFKIDLCSDRLSFPFFPENLTFERVSIE